MPPPRTDQYGFGIRVPSLLISPYAKRHFIDHHEHSFESWLRIVEERFGVQSMTQRDTEATDMLNDFDFTLVPRTPVLLSTAPEGSHYPHALQKLQHIHDPS